MPADSAVTLAEGASIKPLEERKEMIAPCTDLDYSSFDETNSRGRQMVRRPPRPEHIYGRPMTDYMHHSDSDSSDDLTDLDLHLELPDSDIGKATDKVEEIQRQSENGNSINVIYRANLYSYGHGYGHSQTREPRFESSIHGTDPIRTFHRREPEGASGKFNFEITTMYAIPGNRRTMEKNSRSTAVLAEIGTYMTIRSKLVLSILRDIIHYHPSFSPNVDKLVLREPFCLLLHYREELSKRRDELKQATSTSAPLEEMSCATANEHLTYVIDFVNQRYADGILQELSRHRSTRATCTYDWVWLLFRPGSVVYAWDNNILRAHLVEDHDRHVGVEEDGKIRPKVISVRDDVRRLPRSKKLKVTVWTLAFDGERLGRRRKKYSIPAFDGEKEITSLRIFPKAYLKNEKRVHQTLSVEDFLIQRGKSFFELARKSYREHHGETLTFPKRTVS